MAEYFEAGGTNFGFGSAQADWAPSGQQIVYEFLNEENSEGDNQIWTADTSGANKAQLTTNEFSANRAPAWSPDGEWIAWNTDDGVWLMKQDGNEQHLLTQDGSMPAWSPDSQKIVFSKTTADREKVVLWVVNRDGSGEKQLTFNFGLELEE
tara:strand:- start:897 stop:1352 length:456 start_codon:yes stop_codon:yes gene_type:complete